VTSQQHDQPVGYGVDQIVEREDFLPRDGRYGLLTNDAAVTASDPTLRSREALLKAGFNLVRLFSPEHGIAATAADGAAVSHGFDPLTNLEVVSLYGDSNRPAREMLSDLDGMLVDLPDVGTRYYTFIWTMSYVLEVCAELGIPLWILDRPNPIGGDLTAAEGPLLDEANSASFSGRFAIPIRHSLTMGELAQHWNAERQLNATLRVVPAYGWRRADHHPTTGLPFVPPSPAIPNYTSAMLYPGTCLFEATNLSVGRGTAEPFQQIGAPWLDQARLQASFMAHGLPGVASEPVRFTPSVDPHRGRPCKGIRLRITDPLALRPVTMGLSLLYSVIEESDGAFRWSRYPTSVNPQGEDHFARLIGRQDIAGVLEAQQEDIASRIQEWTSVPEWAGRVAAHLCYQQNSYN